MFYRQKVQIYRQKVQIGLFNLNDVFSFGIFRKIQILRYFLGDISCFNLQLLMIPQRKQVFQSVQLGKKSKMDTEKQRARVM